MLPVLPVVPVVPVPLLGSTAAVPRARATIFFLSGLSPAPTKSSSLCREFLFFFGPEQRETRLISYNQLVAEGFDLM